MKKLKILFIGFWISLFALGGIGCAIGNVSDSNSTESKNDVESSFISDETESSERDINGNSSQESDSPTPEDSSTTESTSSQESDEWLDIIFPQS